MISRKFKDICAITTSPLTTASDATLSFVTAGMFSSAAFFELVVLALTLRHAHMLRQSGLGRGKVVSAVTRGNIVYTLVIFLTSVASITFFVLPLEEGLNGLLTTAFCMESWLLVFSSTYKMHFTSKKTSMARAQCLSYNSPWDL
ncbi:hypothetical protein JVU11DRAFT_11478 [Chiua virens]|nr:hypothetical protein JVU11DRAFT_11478 [Chiua virens]